MAAKMIPTRYTGVSKRGSRYVAVWRSGGKQYKKSARTLNGARKLRAAMQADVARDEFDPQTALTFGEYATEWVGRYTGTGRRGFREGTRDEYRRLLGIYAIPWFAGDVNATNAPGRAMKLSAVQPVHMAQFVAWLADPVAQAEHAYQRALVEARKTRAAGKPVFRWPKLGDPKVLSDPTIRNIVNPVRSVFATANREGLIRTNPAATLALPHREQIEDDDDENAKAMTREELAAVLPLIHPRHRLMFKVLAATGMRISEAIALQWRHVRLDGPEPCVRVRRGIVRGRVQPPKSKYGRRDIPIAGGLVDELRTHQRDTEWCGDKQPVFPSTVGTPLNPENVRNRVLAPAAEEADVAWIGFHTFRHTCASMLFARGMNIKAIQKWLGHHDAAFTLRTYVHLMDDEIGAPIELAAELPRQVYESETLDLGEHGVLTPADDVFGNSFER